MSFSMIRGNMESTLATRRRNEILEAALKVFSEKGYHAAKIEDIASELNMGHGTFYRYFENKLDIFNQVVEEIVSMITQLVTDINPHEAETLEDYRRQLEMIGDRLFGLFKSNPSISRVIFYEAFGIEDRGLRERIQEVFDLIGRYIELYLENGIARGYMRADLHVRETALAIGGALFEACKRVVSSSDPEQDLSVWKETIITLIIQGVKKG
ncbi:MAG: TetR/AcrR family transcriptional regulator [Actinobacteria bacterium]|jgi:AcrR family transcriptional regulator|nr:MAG: TetR/AcrR family transcriptional regulator [Actinomycetota bacterium]